MFTKGSIVLFGSSESKYGIWCCQEIHSSHVPGLENGDIIDLRFPSIPISWWGHNKRRAAGDFVWNSDIFLCQLKHLETSWNIFVYHVVSFHACSTFIAVVAGSHAAQPWDPSEYVGQTLLQAGPGRFWSWYFGIFGMLPYVAMRWPD